MQDPQSGRSQRPRSRMPVGPRSPRPVWPASRRPVGPGPRRPVGLCSQSVGLAGVVAVIAGTFLPWVDSGRVSRNLYTIAGVADRIGVLGPGASVSGWLALVGPLCMLPVVLAVLRLRLTAALLALPIGVICGGFAGTCIALAAGRSTLGVGLAWPGPVTVLLGALALAAGAIGVMVAQVRSRRPADVAAAIPERPLPDELWQTGPRRVPGGPH